VPLCELASPLRVVGERQVRRAIESGVLDKLFVARDADAAFVNSVVQEADRRKVPMEFVDTMLLLGRACAISRGASVAGIRADRPAARETKD